ncbi:MAG: Ig-like domain-containing protein [Acidimicrobiales bacterium]
MAAGLAIVVAVPLATGSPAGAAGITTHAWMATAAVDKVDVPALRALLAANIDQVYAGAQFPDSGYVPGTTFGEEAHWQRFHDAYAEVIRAKPGCGPLTDPHGPCAPEIAHLMGAIAHGIGDQVWDWLFEPKSPDLGEYYLPPEFAPVADEGGQELQLDLVAIAIHGRVNPKAPPLPDKADLLTAFRNAGFDGATEAQLDLGQNVQALIHSVEAQWAPVHIAALRAAMPYLSANLITEPGGIEYAATAIAGVWESMWGHLLGQQPRTEVAVSYPADGARRVPATGWVRTYLPGSNRNRGGARTRITATFTSAMPYRVPGGPGVSSQLPAGSTTLVERDTGVAIPQLNGYPRMAPYGPDAGEHTIAIQPAQDLKPCTWYRVGITENLVDHRRIPVVPATWTFRTAADGDGRRCADDPYTDDERWLRRAHTDLYGRTATAGELEDLTYRLDRELDRTAVSSELVSAAEHRSRLVDQTYRAILGRPADPAALASWTDRLATEPLRNLRLALASSPEAFRQAGGNTAAYVRYVHQVLLDRAPTGSAQVSWIGQLNRGTSRSAFVGQLLASPDATTADIQRTFRALLGRRATGAELSTWSAAVAATDERVLEAAILAGAEYGARAS